MMRFPTFFSCFFLLICKPVLAGQYFQDFSSFATGTTSFGDGSHLLSDHLGSVAAVVDSTYKELQLTGGVANNTSAFELPDLDPGTPVYAFSAKWNAPVYGNFPSAGDGFSFNFGQLASLNLLGGSVESGYGAGLCFSVRTSAGGSPGFYLLANGGTLASSAYNATTQWGVNTSTRHLFEVDWNVLTGMTVKIDGTAVFTNVATPGFTPQAGDRMVWAARCDSVAEYIRLDNIAVATGGNLVRMTTGAPYYADANSNSPVHPPSLAFDQNYADFWYTNANTGYVGATAAGTATFYAITSYHKTSSGAAVDPVSFRLEGSNDGTTWTALGAGSGYFLNDAETRFWPTTSGNNYAADRLNILQNNGDSVTALAELQLYGFQAQNGPPPASITYLSPTVTPYGVTVQATIPTSFGNKVTVKWGTDATYGSSATLALNNTSAAQTLSYTLPRVNLAVPIHYQFVCQYAAAPGAYDLTGPDAVVQPAGFQTVAYAPPNYGAGGTFPPPDGYQTLPHVSLNVTADSLVFFDSQNRGVLDLLTTGQAVDSGIAYTCYIFLNANPITSGSAFTTFKPGNATTGISGQLFGGFSTVFNFSNDNYPSWMVGGDCSIYAAFVADVGPHYGLSFGLDFLINGAFYSNVLDPAYGLTVANQHIAGPGRGVAADFDQDGFDDLLILDQNGGLGLNGISSYFTYTPATFLLHNIPNAGQSAATVGLNTTPRLFDPVTTTLPTMKGGSGIYGSTLAVGDVNNDGYPDLFIALLQSDGSYTARIYLNQQGNGFVAGPEIVLPGSTADSSGVFPSAVLADFNGDGNLDLLIAGWGDASAPTTAIYYGDGAGHFTNSHIALPQRSQASVAVGDLFNHGRNDIVLGGYPGDTLVLRNDGGSFTVFDWGMPNAFSTTGRNIALADVDNDGKLDIATGDQENTSAPQTGFYGYPLAIYRNAMNIPVNSPPTAPGILTSTVFPGGVTLTWSAASDDITPPNLLTYNLRVGTSPLGADAVSPLSNVTSGWRKVAAPGNRGHAFQCTYHFPAGTYYWSVQAVDGAYAGGAWAQEHSFTIAPYTPLEAWRYKYFGTTANSGIAADSADAAHIGISNQMAFATAKTPLFYSGSPLEVPTMGTGAYTFEYDRNLSASGIVTLHAEWSSTLAAGSWSTVGITETSQYRTLQTEHMQVTVPTGGANRLFVRLSAVEP